MLPPIIWEVGLEVEVGVGLARGVDKIGKREGEQGLEWVRLREGVEYHRFGLIMGPIFCTQIKILNPGSRDISQKLRQTKCLLFNF